MILMLSKIEHLRLMILMLSEIKHLRKLCTISLQIVKRINRLILDLKLYVVMGIILINSVIPIQFEVEYYIDILTNVGLKIGLFKYKFIGSNVYILLSSYRSILGFKVSILIFVIGLILIPILFMIDNYIFIILSLLSVIFVKAFIMNFYTKHFKLFGGSCEATKNINYLELIINILNNIKKIVKLLLKLWMISIVIIITLRCSISAMLLNEGDINIVSIILIVILPLPIFLYLLNFIIKFIKKEEINSSDYYLYNDFVIERVNLYRIIYLVSINYMIRYYYYTYCIIIITVLIFAILIACVLIIYKLYSQPSNNKVCKAVLESNLGVAMSTVSAFISISPILQSATNTGFIEYYNNTDTANYSGWKKILWSNPGIQLRGSTINFIENRKLDKLLVDNPHRADLLKEYRARVEKSPILNIAYRLKNNDATVNSPNTWSIRPVTLFSNKRYYGSVSLVIKEKKFGRFLVVVMIRHDSAGCIFMPTYFLPEGSQENIQRASRTKITETVNLLEYKYNIAIPRHPNRNNGLIIFTQAESINDQGLFKIWRPSINYTEPVLEKTIKDYFLIEEEKINRPEDFSTCVDTARYIKKRALAHTRDYSDFIKADPKAALSKKVAKDIARSEFEADKKFKELVQFYISKGSDTNSSEYQLIAKEFYEDYPDNFKDALEIAKANVEASKLEESYRDPNNVKDHLDNVISEFERLQSNNQYIDHKYYYLQTRREYSISHTLIPIMCKYVVYFNLYKTGILEGFKNKDQTLGDLSSKFILPLKDSRTELVKDMSIRFSDPESKPFKKYGVSINRLTYEFFEVIPSSDIWGVFLDEVFTDDGKDIIPNCEVYSIIDITNNSTKSAVLLNSGNHYITLPKHDYNLFNYQDEYSIRKFMDFIYENKDGSLTYQSDEKNLDVADIKSIDWARSIKPKNKNGNRVGFGQDAVDYKKKEPKGIHYTLEALERPEKEAKAKSDYIRDKKTYDARIDHIRKNGKDIDNAGEILRKGKEVIDKGKSKSIEGESIEQDESIGQDELIEQNQAVGQPEFSGPGGPSQFTGQYQSLEVGGLMAPTQFTGQYPHMWPNECPGQYPYMWPNEYPGQYPHMWPNEYPGQYPHMWPNEYPGQYPDMDSNQNPAPNPPESSELVRNESPLFVQDSPMAESSELVRNESPLFVQDSPMAESSCPTEQGESSKKVKSKWIIHGPGGPWKSKGGLARWEYLDMRYENMYARKYIYLGGERAPSEDDTVNESGGKQVSKGKAVAEPKGKKVTKGKKVPKDKTVTKSKGKKASRFVTSNDKQVSKGKEVAFNPEVEYNEYQYNADDFHSSPDEGFSFTNWGPSSYTNWGPTSSTNGGPSSEYENISSAYRYEDGYRATGFISPCDNLSASSTASSTTNSNVYKDNSYEYLPMDENNGGYILGSSSGDISENDNQKYPLHKTSTDRGSIYPTHLDMSKNSPAVIHISSDDSSSVDLYGDDSHEYPQHKTSSVALACGAEVTATGNNMDVSPKDTVSCALNITDTDRNLGGNNTDISEYNAGIDNIDTSIEENDVSLDRSHLDLPDNEDCVMEDSNSIDNTTSNNQDIISESDDIPLDIAINSLTWDIEHGCGYDEFGPRGTQEWVDAIRAHNAMVKELYRSKNEIPDSHTAVDTSEIDSPVVANMEVEAEESVEFNTTVEDAEVRVARAIPTTVASHETTEVEESQSISEVREIEESNSSYPYPSGAYPYPSGAYPYPSGAAQAKAMDQQATVEITETEPQTTIQGDVAASEDLPEESGADMNSEEDIINSAPAIEENQRINANSPVYPSLHNGESEAPFLHIEGEYGQPDPDSYLDPDSFLDIDPCGVDVDFYGYEYHENVRQQRREAEGAMCESYEAENETDAVVDLDEVIAAEYRERLNNTRTSVRRDISEEGAVNSSAADNQDISEEEGADNQDISVEELVNSSAADNQDISGEDVINSPTTFNQYISEDIDIDVPNSPSELSQDISGEEDIDIMPPMPRPNSEGEIVFDTIIARSEDPEGNEMSVLVASGFRESYL